MGARRSPTERGATLVEYALVVALLVVGAIGAIQFLQREGNAEVAAQADCVSTRPPPPSCQIRAVTTSTTRDPWSTTTSTGGSGGTGNPNPDEEPDPGSTTSTTSATTTTTAPSPPTTVAPFEGSVHWSVETDSLSNERWRALVDLQVADASGRSPGRVDVVIAWRVVDPSDGSSGTVSCTSGWNGRCEDVRVGAGDNRRWGSQIRRVEISIVSVDGVPIGGSPPLVVRRP